MINQKIVGVAILYSLFFEALEAEPFGFYLMPTALAALLFSFLPFTFTFLNIILAVLVGFLAMLFEAAFLNPGVEPSLGFLLHILIYLFILLILFYIFHEAKAQ